jgi:ribosomal-protein-serine acetyltransferase
MFQQSTDLKIKLQLLEPADAPAIFALIEQNRDYLRQWLPWVDNNTQLSDSEGFIRAGQQRLAAGRGFEAGLWQHDQLVGIIGLHDIHPNTRSTEIGYWLGAAFTGQGLMTLACQIIVEHCFTTLGLNSVRIACAVGNHKSAAIAERLGFRLDGISREAEWVNGQLLDQKRYSLLQREWVAQQ